MISTPQKNLFTSIENMFTPAKPPLAPQSISSKADSEILNVVMSRGESLNPLTVLRKLNLTERGQEKENYEKEFKRPKSNLKGTIQTDRTFNRSRSKHRVRFFGNSIDKINNYGNKKSTTRSSRKKKKKGSVVFSHLPLNLKKQFMLFLFKNKVEFKEVDHTGYVEAKVKLISEKKNDEGVKVILTKDDIARLTKTVIIKIIIWPRIQRKVVIIKIAKMIILEKKA